MARYALISVVAFAVGMLVGCMVTKNIVSEGVEIRGSVMHLGQNQWLLFRFLKGEEELGRAFDELQSFNENLMAEIMLRQGKNTWAWRFADVDDAFSVILRRNNEIQNGLRNLEGER